MRVRDKNNPEKVVNAIQYYGEKIAGFDGEYSERPKWLGMVIHEYSDKTTVKLYNGSEQLLNINDWFIFDDSKGHIEIIDVISNDEFKANYKSVYF